MEYRFAGENATFTIDFTVDGEYVVPDESSLFLTVRDSSGIPYPGLNKASLADVTTTSTEVEIDSVVQSTDDDYALRYLTVYFKYLTRQYQVDVPFTVHQFIPLGVSKENIRDLFGAEYRELPDSDIDLYLNYFIMVKEYGETFKLAFSTALAVHNVNLALSYFTALSLIPQMRSRLLSRERNDTSEFERFKINFDALKLEFEARLQAELTKTFELMGSTEYASVGAGALYSSFIVSTPTDPFTGS